ncbi:hypothetical protein ACFS7Z_03010 [Pontibacter toksunensis]|uniref:Uncharacterized protein n=1 Tax=Pontibacter toksunensis TaxID=1332631 RepID=A0ABW6BN78_9BACT
MKTLYKLLFVLCLLVGTSCSQNAQEEEITVESAEEGAAEKDTTQANDEVPEELMHH